MINIDATDRIIISGLTGTGKTYLMRYFATQYEPAVFIIDPLDQYKNFPDECRYIPRRETPQEFEQIAKRFWATGNTTIIIEEAEQYLPQGRAMLPYTSGLIRMSRNWGNGIFASTRRIQDISKRFFDLAQHAFFFQCGLQSRDYIGRMIGPEFVWEYPSPKYNKTGYSITTLPPYHFLHLDLKSEIADVGVLRLGFREHIEGVGKKAETPTKIGKGEKPEEVQEQEAKAQKGEKVEQASKETRR